MLFLGINGKKNKGWSSNFERNQGIKGAKNKKLSHRILTSVYGNMTSDPSKKLPPKETKTLSFLSFHSLVHIYEFKDGKS